MGEMKRGVRSEYGLIAAGAVKASLIGRLPRNGYALGPVAGVSFRVASRIANALGAGWPSRSLDEFESVRTILVHAPPEHAETLIELVDSTRISWSGKSLVFCDCEPDSFLKRLQDAGASVAVARHCGIPGRLLVGGMTPALGFAHRVARELRMKPIEVPEGSVSAFEAALLLGTAGLTPLIDYSARLLRQCGVRDAEAGRLAAALFAQTANEYAYSGRQSWAWHARHPGADVLKTQLKGLAEPFKSILGAVVLMGLEGFERYPEAAELVRELSGKV